MLAHLAALDGTDTGVAANSAWLFGHVEKFAGQRLTPVRLLGGGAQSSLWCQIYANTLDREIEQVHDPLVAQLRGVALLASVSMGLLKLDEVATRVTPGVTFSPAPGDAATYLARRVELPSLYARDKSWRNRRRPVD